MGDDVGKPFSEAWTQHHGLTWPLFVKRVDYLFAQRKMDSALIATVLFSDEPTVCRAIALGREWRRAAA